MAQVETTVVPPGTPTITLDKLPVVGLTVEPEGTFDLAGKGLNEIYLEVKVGGKFVQFPGKVAATAANKWFMRDKNAIPVVKGMTYTFRAILI